MILTEKNIQDEELLKNIKIDGICSTLLRKKMISTGKWDDNKVNKVFSTSISALEKFPDPSCCKEKREKILCLGKVQSGKTAFFISTMAMAMDNGYDLIYVIGGTKNNLLTQNSDRIKKEFSNNPDIFVTNINDADPSDIRMKISAGIKVVVMVLKGKNEKSDRNLQGLEILSERLKDFPTLIIDDEGDQVSPGNEKNKKKPAVVYSAIVNVINNISVSVYLSVTATPQANLLVSTLNGISPDYCVLIKPGVGYTGANTFHDSIENNLVEGISDNDDFELGVPDSFINALYFFIVGCAIQRSIGNIEKYSMLIHPSAYTKVQHDVFIKVKNLLMQNIFSALKSENSIGYEEVAENIKNTLAVFKERMEVVPDFDTVINSIRKNFVRTGIFEINTPANVDASAEDFCQYKIYVGGNMLERGITLENLTVTYIYRVAKKENAVDTMFQRARWFGYKHDYLHLCKVFMPLEMKKMFVQMTDHENYLWLTVEEYLLKNADIKELPRVFQLETDNTLVLTRKTISKTIDIGKNTSGYSYDRSIWFEMDEIERNIAYWEKFYGSHEGEQQTFGNQTHLIFKDVCLRDFLNQFLTEYSFARGANKINRAYFEFLLNAVEEGLIENKVSIVKMRDGVNQFRSTDAGEKTIKELPQSYDVKSGYPGDKRIIEEGISIQIHYVYIDKSNPQKLIPMLAVNNPFDAVGVNYVTGDNYYGTN